MRHYIYTIVAGLGLLGLVSSAALAASVIQGFQSDSTLPVGTIVSTAGNNKITPTTSANAGSIAGVVLDSQGALISLDPQGSNTPVAVSGDVVMLVSDINGNIKTGDTLVISPIAGVAMRYTPESSTQHAIGAAKADFSGSQGTVEKVLLQTNDNQTVTAEVGKIDATLNPHTIAASAVNSDGYLQVAGKKLSGHSVSLLQVLASLLTIIASFVLAGIILSSTVRSTIVSLGRNPLSRPSIISGLTRVIGFSIGLIAVGTGLAYVILLI